MPRKVPLLCRTVKGVSLVEILVVLVVVATLTAILFRALRASRESARTAVCETHIRQLGGLLSMYCQDFKGYYPTFVANDSVVVDNPRWWPAYTLQSLRVFATQGWFRHTGVGLESPIYRCPSNRMPKTPQVAASDYLGVPVMHGDPSFFESDAEPKSWKGRLGAKVQKIDDVVFPGDKVGLWELSVWHGWRGTWIPGGVISGLTFSTSDRKASLWFFDGHVAGLAASGVVEGVHREPVWHSGKLYTTPGGSRGRDVDRGAAQTGR